MMDVNYRIQKSKKRKKTISLRIQNESEIIVSAPYFTPTAEINRFIEEKQNWIQKTLRQQKDAALKNKAKEYQAGETFLYLGQAYPLEVFFEPFENEGVVFSNGRFYLNAREDRELRKRCFVAWYKKKAAEYFRQRVEFYSRILKLQPENIRITLAKSRWGSCSEDDRLAFSFPLIMAPPVIIDYVIVHELAHIREKNHSRNFWRLVEAIIPDYDQSRRWLRINQQLLNI